MKNYLLITLFFISMSVPAQQCSTLVAQGDSLYRKMDDYQALVVYKNTYYLCPDNYQALMKMVRALNDVGEKNEGEKARTFFVDAFSLSDTLIGKYPDSAQSYFLKAVSAGNLADVSELRNQIRYVNTIESNARKAIELKPQYSPPYVVLGILYRRIAQINPMIKAIVRAVNGKIPDVNLNDSETEIKKALKFDPRNMYAYYELGVTFLAMGKKDQAEANFRKVLKLPVTESGEKRVYEQANKRLETK